MDDNCDLENETLESPITILLFFVIMYFKTGGGIDSVLHCQWMPYVRDPLKASIGRAGYVSPGSPMRTGFTRPDPRSLADYDDNTRTAVVQPWMINLLWYTAAIEQHPSLFQALLHIAQQSDHYDAVTGERQPLKNWFPTESRISRVTKARMKGESCAEETDGENDLDVEPQDETEQLAFGELDTGMPEEQTTKTPDEIKKAQYEQLEQLKAEFAAQDPRRYDSRYVSAAFETLGDAIEAFDSSTFEKTLEKLHTFMETGHEDTTCVSCRLVYRKDPMIKCGSHSEDGWMHNAPACCADIGKHRSHS